MIPSNLKEKYPKPITLLLFPCLFQLFWGKEIEDLCVFVLKELPCCLLELSLSTDLARSHRRIFMLEGEKNDTLIFRIFFFFNSCIILKKLYLPHCKMVEFTNPSPCAFVSLQVFPLSGFCVLSWFCNMIHYLVCMKAHLI